MTESIQKKLLRVRPPRVRITYDVETGGALEKKELPFIVGILADLSGNRAQPDEFPPLKERRMVDIDRDNFNDVMKTIGPRIDLTSVAQAVPELSTPADKAIVLSHMDGFTPLRVVDALPALRAKYQARSHIRALQAKAESDDTVARLLDGWVEDDDPAALGQRQQALIDAFTAPAEADKAGQRQALLVLHDKLAAGGADASTELGNWSLPPGDTAATKTAALEHGRLLVAMAGAADTPENRKQAKELVKMLTAPAPAEGAADANQEKRTGFATRLGYADAAAAKTALDPLVPKLDAAGTEGKQALAKALLLFGLTQPDEGGSVDAAAYPDARELSEARLQADARGAVLAFSKYLKDKTGGAGPDLAKRVFPLLRALAPAGDGVAAAKVLLALRFFSNQVVSGLHKEDKDLLKVVKKGVVAVIDEQVTLIDQQLSRALSAIMHCENFKEMEQTWRGLHYLVSRTETGVLLKLRVFNATKDELRKDMEKAVEFDQSVLFKLVYEAEYGTFGGYPYSLLVGGYEINGSNEDIAFLKKISEVAASAHAPFIAAASSKLFGLTGFDKLDKPRDLKKVFESPELIGWREFREMEDARYVSLVLPRVLLRLPYGAPEKRNTVPCEGLNFEEHVGETDAAPVLDANGDMVSHPVPDNSNFLWGNPAYVLAERITNAFALYNWTAAIRGVEGGGLVEGLPVYTYTSEAGTTDLLCPTEVSITDRREKELNDLGFISLCHCKGSGKAAFFGGQTTNAPKKYFSEEANANAKISAMLPYMLAASRFAHYIKVIMREKIGSFLTRGNVETYLNSWISNYVLLDDNATQEVKAAYPLRAASVVVTEVPGEPGVYKATAFLKPHFQLEELTTSIRLVANLPK